MVKVAFAFKSQGIGKNEFFSKEPEDCRNLTYESLVIVDAKYIKISSLAQSCSFEYKIVTERNRYFLT